MRRLVLTHLTRLADRDARRDAPRQARRGQTRCLAACLTLGLMSCLAACQRAEPSPATTSSPPGDGGPTPQAPSTRSDQTPPSVVVAPASAGPKDRATPQRDDEHTSFDLVDNRHLAHHTAAQGLWIDLGRAGALKYVQGRWKNPWYDQEREADARFAYAKGVGALVRAPLGLAGQEGQTDGGWILRARLKPAGDQRCDVFIAQADGPEQRLGSWAFPGDQWTEQTLALPAGLRLGRDVTVRFHLSKSQSVADKKTAAAFDWIYLGPKPATDQALAPPRSPFDAQAASIKLEAEHALTWHTMPAPGARLRAKLSGELTVQVQAQGSPLKEHTLSGPEVDLPLEVADGTPIRLTLTARAQGAALTQPRLITSPRPATPQGKPPRVIVVWLIDTLRADHLKAYNPRSDVQTPNLDAFAAEAAVFERASVQGNSSLPSSASIFTSSYPSAHKLVTEKARLSEQQVLLGEALRQAGWRTGLFSSNGYVSKTWGFARGFDHETNPIRQNTPSKAEYLWPAASSWLKARLAEDAQTPIVLYLNTSDPHVPYDPPPADLKLYHPSGTSVGKVTPRATGQLLHDMAEGKVTLSAAEVAYMRALYKGAITYNDRWFGAMLKDLEELGVREEAMIVVTSDHGEEFGEHGRFGHGISLFQELVDVPLIIGYRPWTAKGVRRPEAVELIDLYPTLLEATQRGQASPGLQGRSLVELMRDPTPKHPWVSFAYHNDFLLGARVADWKYLLFQGDKDPVHRLRYTDLSKLNPAKPDSIEGEDLRTSSPIARRMMRDLMAFHARRDAQWSKTRDGLANNHSAALAHALDEQGW